MAVACTVGSDFIRPNDNELVIGSTTKRAALVVVGEPRGKGFLVVNGKTIEVLDFLYVESGGQGTLPGVSPIRVMKLWFHDDVLIAKRFYSSFKSDSATFDYRLASAIKPGMSEREVIALLGPPKGEYRYPLLADPGARAMVYGYTERTGSTPVANVLNFVTVELDEGRKVRTINLEDGRTPVQRYDTPEQAAFDADGPFSETKELVAGAEVEARKESRAKAAEAPNATRRAFVASLREGVATIDEFRREVRYTQDHEFGIISLKRDPPAYAYALGTHKAAGNLWIETGLTNQSAAAQFMFDYHEKSFLQGGLTRFEASVAASPPVEECRLLFVDRVLVHNGCRK